jgi:hypothetical protein
MRIPRTIRTLALAAATALAAGACSDSNAPTKSFVGSYALISVNGETLPLSIIDQPSLRVTLESGSLLLSANNTFTETVTLGGVVDGVTQPPEQLSCSGTYTRSGDKFTLTAPASESCSGDTLNGTLDGTTLTFTDDTGETLVFRR